jgi:hypothetical protein
VGIRAVEVNGARQNLTPNNGSKALSGDLNEESSFNSSVGSGRQRFDDGADRHLDG